MLGLNTQTTNENTSTIINGVELLGYNIDIYNQLKESFNYSNKSSLMHMTSGGKSYIACALMRGGYNKILILAPKNCICDEWLGNKYTPKNVTALTYQSLLYDKESKIDEDYDLIIYDEFHHIGAFKWQSVVNWLQEKYSNAHHLGLSATPVRYLDNVRCMADEFFDNNLVEGVTLLDAIKAEIITPPVYIAGGYIFNEEKSRSIITAINRNFMLVPNGKYTKVIKALNAFFNLKSNVELMSGVIKKYVDAYRDTSKCLKFIAFTPNVAEALDLETSMVSWFNHAYPNKTVKIYHINSKQSVEDLQDNIKTFKTIDDDSTINIAISIDMISEGVHYPKVDGVFMFRRTMSPNIYYQQIGRCINPRSKDRALIFDFMDNYSGVGNIESNCLRFRDNNAKSFFKGLLIESDLKYNYHKDADSVVFLEVSEEDETGEDSNKFTTYFTDNYLSKEKVKKPSTLDDVTKIKFIDVSLDIKELLEDINSELAFNIDGTISRLEQRYAEGRSVLIINDDDLLMSLKRRLSRAVGEKGLILTEQQEARLKRIGLVFGKGSLTDIRLLNIQRTLALLDRYNEDKTALSDLEIKKLNNGKVVIRKALNKGSLPKELVDELANYGFKPSKSMLESRKDKLTCFANKLINGKDLTKKERDALASLARFEKDLDTEGRGLLKGVLEKDLNSLKELLCKPKSNRTPKEDYWESILSSITEEYKTNGFIFTEQNMKACRNILKRYSMHTTGAKPLNPVVLDFVENSKVPLHKNVNTFLCKCYTIKDTLESGVDLSRDSDFINWKTKVKEDLDKGRLGKFELETLDKLKLIN